MLMPAVKNETIDYKQLMWAAHRLVNKHWINVDDNGMTKIMNLPKLGISQIDKLRVYFDDDEFLCRGNLNKL
jgi:hypothetical protein